MCNVHPAPQDRAHILATLASATAIGDHVLVMGHDRSDFGHGHGSPSHRWLYFTTDALSQGLDGIQLLAADRAPAPPRAGRDRDRCRHDPLGQRVEHHMPPSHRLLAANLPELADTTELEPPRTRPNRTPAPGEDTATARACWLTVRGHDLGMPCRA